MAYKVGNVIRFATNGPIFTTVATGAPIDPGTVFFVCTVPAGTIRCTWTGGAGGSSTVDPSGTMIVRDSTGAYHADVVATAIGTYHGHFYSTGAGQGSDDRTVTVVDGGPT